MRKPSFAFAMDFARGSRKTELPTDRLCRISDWGDTEAIRPVPSDGSFRGANGIASGQFVVLHTGNMGKKQDLLNLVRAAELTRGDANLHWVIVGEGEERALIENATRDRGSTIF